VRNDVDLGRGNFRVKGDTIDVFPAYSETLLRITFWDEEIDALEELDATTLRRVARFPDYQLYPANLFMTTEEQTQKAIRNIQDDLAKQVQHFEQLGDPIRAQRIKERVEYDMEMIKELGHCSGIENYSRYFDGREAGERPYCLLDFFPDDFLLVVDESHVSVPQIRAMYGGDRARKQNLVEYGFRLPAAFDNRPLTFDEFQQLVPQTIYVSATPAEFELSQAEGVVVEQVVRPTGLLDPQIVVRPSENQIDDLLEEIRQRCERHERTLVTTLTKRMAEELTEYLLNHDVRTAYIHSDVATLDRVKTLDDLRAGVYDVLVGVNLLREGLDLPEVSLVAILDADKEGFLRSHRSLTQTAGRAARNVNGMVIMYADTITESMQQTIDETNRRREKQTEYNTRHHITPTQIQKQRKQSQLHADEALPQGMAAAPLPYATNDDMQPQGMAAEEAFSLPVDKAQAKPYAGPTRRAADPIVKAMSRQQLEKSIAETTRLMKEAAKKLDFMQAALYRDELLNLQQKLEEKSQQPA